MPSLVPWRTDTTTNAAVWSDIGQKRMGAKTYKVGVRFYERSGPLGPGLFVLAKGKDSKPQSDESEKEDHTERGAQGRP